MSDDEVLAKLYQLSPDELLSIFRAVLLCEISLNHVQDGTPEFDGQLSEPLQDEFRAGHIASNYRQIGGGETRQRSDIRVGSAA